LYSATIQDEVYRVAEHRLLSHAALTNPADCASRHPVCAQYFETAPPAHKINFLNYVLACVKRGGYSVLDEETVHCFMEAYDDSLEGKNGIKLVQAYILLSAMLKLDDMLELKNAAARVIPKEYVVRALPPVVSEVGLSQQAAADQFFSDFKMDTGIG
jgi:hypothetical protein